MLPDESTRTVPCIPPGGFMEAIKSWVVNIAAVAILMILFDLLMPEGRLRKFAQLLSGFILMFVMINPVLGLFGKSAVLDGWADETFLLSNQVKKIAVSLQDERSGQTLELYRSMLLSDIQNRLLAHEQIEEAEVDPMIYENRESEKYGQIRRLFIRLTLKGAWDGAAAGGQQKLVEQIQRELQQVFLLKEDEIVIHIVQGE
jgi:stage III sporulation protein AF